MKQHRIILNTVLLVLALGILTPQFAQEPSTDSEKTDLHHTLGRGLVRTVNTAEMVERISYGSYSAWPTLLAHQQKKFDQWLGMQGLNERLGDMPDILPGWKLRLNVHPDGQGYDLRLQDTISKNWAVFSDEGGVIWVAAPLQ